VGDSRGGTDLRLAVAETEGEGRDRAIGIWESEASKVVGAPATIGPIGVERATVGAWSGLMAMARRPTLTFGAAGLATIVSDASLVPVFTTVMVDEPSFKT
jgi:hypothetical protein